MQLYLHINKQKYYASETYENVVRSCFSTKTSLAIDKQQSHASQSISKLIHSNPTGLTCVASKHVDSRAQI